MKALIFDMDGVLVDVSQSYRLAIKKTAEFFTGEKITDEEIQELKNKGNYNNDWNATEALILKRSKNIPKKEIIDKFQEFYIGDNFNGLIENETWLLKKKTLEQLKDRFVFGIVTGRPREEAEYALEKSGIKNFFEVIITMEDTEEEKPDPFPLRIALEQLNCQDGYYIGDCVDDMEMAVNAGIIGIGVLPSGVNGNLRQLLIENGAKTVLNDINDLKEVLE